MPPRPVHDLGNQALPAYDLLDWQPYAGRNITPAILTKRGCAFACTYCPYSKLEGKRYRLKRPQRVVAEAILRALIAEKADLQWGTGNLRPMGVTDDFCRLMEASGCFYVNLSIESASQSMLQSMKRGYTVQQVWDSLEALSRSKIPFGASLVLGAPGETPETIAETLDVLDDYEIPNGVWVTVY